MLLLVEVPSDSASILVLTGRPPFTSWIVSAIGKTS